MLSKKDHRLFEYLMVEARMRKYLEVTQGDLHGRATRSMSPDSTTSTSSQGRLKLVKARGFEKRLATAG
jgi:hypothetical protein